MAALQRKLAIMTSMGKKYSGMVDVPTDSFRTTDLLNSSNIFWRNPNEKCYEDAIMMYDAHLFIDETTVYKKYEKIQIKLSEIFYFYDEIEMLGDETEKKRATTMTTNIKGCHRTAIPACSTSYLRVYGSTSIQVTRDNVAAL